MKIVSIVGARPQFIKAAPVQEALGEHGHLNILVHTGQHYDDRMSRIFFTEMGIPEPDVNLGVGSGSHGAQTAAMLVGIEEILVREQPDWVIVYGDTNSTIAGAFAACKQHFPIAHVESGLRSFNRQMPEEHNRVLTDHCSDILFCPTRTAMENLARESIVTGAFLVGDTMFDAVLQFGELARKRSSIVEDLDLQPEAYILATLHRPYTVDVPERLSAILETLMETGESIVVPLHPRTRKQVCLLNQAFQARLQRSSIKLIEPIGYLDMLRLEQSSKLILTDSGGVQKEAYFFEVPCLTLRPETEWIETVDTGWNRIVDTDRQTILEHVRNGAWPTSAPPKIFGDGNASIKIVDTLSNWS